MYLSSVTRAFYRQIVRENRIPLNLSYEPNAQSLEALVEIESMANAGQARFRNADEMFDSLNL